MSVKFYFFNNFAPSPNALNFSEQKLNLLILKQNLEILCILDQHDVYNLSASKIRIRYDDFHIVRI